MENCLNLAIRTEGVSGSVAPTIDQDPDTKKAALLPLPSLINAFLARIVRLDSLRLNDHGRVGFLPVLTLRGDRSCHVARTQSKGSAECRERDDEHRDHDFNNLLLTHGLPPFVTDADAECRTHDRRCTSSTPSWSSFRAGCSAEPRSQSGLG